MSEISSSEFARNVNIHDVAAALGMHKSTVSLALSGKGNVSKKTCARVLEVATQMGYEPHPLAQRLANGVHNSLVCLCSGGLDVGLTTEKILRIQHGLSQSGFEVPIYTFAEWSDPCGPSQAIQVRNLCRQQPRAIVCAAQALNPIVFEELARYQNHDGLVVSYDIEVPILCDQIVFDREDNAYRGARHLIDEGHRNLGFAMSMGARWPSSDASLPQNQRIAGFRRALDEAGLPWREEWMFRHGTYETGGAQLAAQFLACSPRPTALCIVNDYVALAFMVEMARHGVRVPDDVSVMGHDNQAVAAYCPVPLSSISQPVGEIAAAVVERLNARLKGATDAPQKIVVRGEFIERSSVAPR